MQVWNCEHCGFYKQINGEFQCTATEEDIGKILESDFRCYFEFDLILKEYVSDGVKE